MWKGVGYNIDSVFQWKDGESNLTALDERSGCLGIFLSLHNRHSFSFIGKTYFFKGKGFWKFNDLRMRVEHERQLSSAQFWMGCPTERTGRRSPFRTPQAPGSTLRSPSSVPRSPSSVPRSPSSAPNHIVNKLTIIYSSLLVLICYFQY